jgi:hypothetical protein
MVHEGIGVELATTDEIVLSLLHLLTNDPKLFQIVQEITGCSPIGCFTGRVYRMTPGCEHYDSWHEDMMQDRMLAMSINLSSRVYSGGILQIRDRNSLQIIHEIANNGLGDAIIFRLQDSLQHRISNVEGTVPKTAFAGWFRSKPNFLSLLTKEFDEPRVKI